MEEFSSKVADLLQHCNIATVSMRSVCDELGITVYKMHKQLNFEGTCWMRLLRSERDRRVSELLKTNPIPTHEEVMAVSGYSKVSAYSQYAKKITVWRV